MIQYARAARWTTFPGGSWSAPGERWQGAAGERENESGTASGFTFKYSYFSEWCKFRATAIFVPERESSILFIHLVIVFFKFPYLVRK
jgi:hypothetical protein